MQRECACPVVERPQLRRAGGAADLTQDGHRLIAEYRRQIGCCDQRVQLAVRIPAGGDGECARSRRTHRQHPVGDGGGRRHGGERAVQKVSDRLVPPAVAVGQPRDEVGRRDDTAEAALVDDGDRVHALCAHRPCRVSNGVIPIARDESSALDDVVQEDAFRTTALVPGLIVERDGAVGRDVLPGGGVLFEQRLELVGRQGIDDHVGRGA